MTPIDVPPPDPYELNEEFVEISDDILEASRWKEAFAVHMQFPEHITLLEGRGVVASLRRKLRSKQEHGKRRLRLNDNMAVVFNVLKRQIGGILI